MKEAALAMMWFAAGLVWAGVIVPGDQISSLAIPGAALVLVSIVLLALALRRDA